MNLKFAPEIDCKIQLFRQCIKITTSPYSLPLALANRAEDGCSGALAPENGFELWGKAFYSTLQSKGFDYHRAAGCHASQRMQSNPRGVL
jgi:hypothetical protein